MCAKSRPSSDSEADGERPSLHYEFELPRFLERAESTRLGELLRARTPSIGIAGPRGSGKTWLIRWAVERAKGEREAKEAEGVGTWFRCPTKYNEREFTMALFERFCWDSIHAIERKRRSLSILGSIRRLRLRFLSAFLVPFALAIILTVLISASIVDLTVWPLIGTWILVILLAVPVAIGLSPISLIPGSKLEELHFTSYKHLENLQFAESREKSGGVEIGADKGFKVTGQFARKLVQRPLTFIGIVEAFREYTEQVAKQFPRVVIAVDDLDKLASPDDTREFLLGIRGLFGSKGVSFIVSLSDEAVDTYELRTFGARDDVDSSFGDIIRVTPLTVKECNDVLAKRGISPSSPLLFDLLGVLSAGNSRDLIRQARETYFQNVSPPPDQERKGYRTLTSAGWRSIAKKRGQTEKNFATKVVAHFARLESEAVTRRLRWQADLSDASKKAIADLLTIKNVKDLREFDPWASDAAKETEPVQTAVGGKTRAHEAYPIVRHAETRLAVMSFIVKKINAVSRRRKLMQDLQEILILNESSPSEAKTRLKDLSLPRRQRASPQRSLRPTARSLDGRA